MVWVIVGVSLAVAALAAIGFFAFGVFRAAKDVSKELARASRLLADAAEPVKTGLAQVALGNGSRSRPASSEAEK
jgi:beta-lactamase regulating signal transducer with metallopeptidase domain